MSLLEVSVPSEAEFTTCCVARPCETPTLAMVELILSLISLLDEMTLSLEKGSTLLIPNTLFSEPEEGRRPFFGHSPSLPKQQTSSGRDELCADVELSL